MIIDNEKVKEKKKPTDGDGNEVDGEEEEVDENEEMMELLGFAGFNTTKVSIFKYNFAWLLYF